jgi:hypothetical protein
MRLDHGARLAGYATLALSSICLLHAEQLFMPNIGWCIPVVLALIAAAYRLEGRWALPVWAANLIAFFSCAGMIVALRVYVEDNPQSFAANVPLPTAWVPFAGPPFLVLLLVKLFRARKSSEIWHLQGMGLLQAALACVLGGDPLVGLLLCGYLVSGLWWLALRFLQQRQERDPASRIGTRVPWRWAGIPRAIGRLFIAFTCGLVLALITPRISPSPWNPVELLGASPHGPAETGVPNSIDLNREGKVEMNDEIVIEIEARDAAGNPKPDLSLRQRFRGAHLDLYEAGLWVPAKPFPPAILDVVVAVPQVGPDMAEPPGKSSFRPGNGKGGAFGGFRDAAGRNQVMSGPRLQRQSGPRLPDLGPTEYFLTFKLRPRKAGGMFLAEPVLSLPEHASLPVMLLPQYAGHAPLFSEVDGGLVHVSPPKGELEYRQVTRPVDDPDIGPPVEILQVYESILLQEPPKPLRQWTNELVRRLASTAGSGLSAKDFDEGRPGDRLRAPPQKREKIARALCKHLRDSGEYTYTLDLRREDHSIDPTEDFLRNVKQGHCQRYAAGLTLMLRSLGIPARIVKGYRGCESEADGVYHVRNNNAHAWVEALVIRNDGKAGARLHWLSLDPTPDTEALPAPPFSFAKWWENCSVISVEFWRFFIAEYGTEEQSTLANEVRQKITSGGTAATGSTSYRAWLLIVPPVLIAGFAVYVVRRRRRVRSADGRPSPPVVPFYARFLDLLDRHARLLPSPGQTPREFCELVGILLVKRHATAALATLPAQIAALYYRVRYGGKPLTEDEGSAIDQRLDEFARTMSVQPAWVAAAVSAG